LEEVSKKYSREDGSEVVVVPQIIQQQTGPALSTKDANLLKELGQKFPGLEDLVKKLQKFRDFMWNAILTFPN